MLNKANFCKGLRAIGATIASGMLGDATESKEYAAGAAEGYEKVAATVESTEDVWEAMDALRADVSWHLRKMDHEYTYSTNHRGEGLADGMGDAIDLLSRTLYANN